mgnify:CR=1 FL=1
MPIRIEFYGIPRHRAGCEFIEVAGDTVATVLAGAVRALPGLSDCCTPDGELHANYIANLNGEQFVSNTHLPVSDGDVILLLSSDAGG